MNIILIYVSLLNSLKIKKAIYYQKSKYMTKI